MQLIGRPTKYSDELANIIFYKIATSTVGIKTLCKVNKELPSHDTIYQWRHRSKHFSDCYLAAKAVQLESLIEKCNATINDITYYKDSLGNIRIDPNSVKLQIAKANAIKWYATKLIGNKVFAAI